eukprot:1442768-Heterocapsa_arctica.AAC.1
MRAHASHALASHRHHSRDAAYANFPYVSNPCGRERAFGQSKDLFYETSTPAGLIGNQQGSTC